MKSSNHEFELYVLVGDKPIKEYSHEQSLFVEGRAGSEYTIRVRNGTSSRACFILSVDGLSVLDGKECSDTSPGYILSAGEKLDVLCYKVDDATGAKFVFGTKDESYSAQIGKGTDNVGVIAARIFREKARATYSHDPGWSHPAPLRPRKRLGEWTYSGGYGRLSKGIAGSLSSGPTKSMGMGSGPGPVDESLSLRRMAGIDRDAPRGIVSSNSSMSCSTTAPTSAEVKTGGGIVQDSLCDSAYDIEEQKLGTVFGESVGWKTEKVSFVKASTLPDASLVVYYDTRKNLEKRGIKFRQEPAPLPNPFPGNTGCETPPGWRK